jgi:hypothetical protein
MRRGPIFVAATALACLPAVTGLVGNQSFSHSVPVRVPSQAHIGSPDATASPMSQPAQPPETRSPTTASGLDHQRGKDVTEQPAGNEHFSPGPSPLPRPESSRTSGKGADDGRPAEKSSDGHGRGPSREDHRGHQ